MLPAGRHGSVASFTPSGRARGRNAAEFSYFNEYAQQN
jgi:hypothetical protein